MLNYLISQLIGENKEHWGQEHGNLNQLSLGKDGLEIGEFGVEGWEMVVA